MSTATCVVCDAQALEPHLQVTGDAGEAGLIPTTDRFGTALGDILRCPRCGHMQLDRFPSEVELASAYGEAASAVYVGEEAGQRVTARRILERIEVHADGRELLDVGCWVGFLLAEAVSRGWVATGIEPSEFASVYARQQLGLNVQTADLLTANVDGSRFDAVVMADVIEHLIDPGAALERVRTLMRPRGVLALVLPDAGSRLARSLGKRWWSVIPTHVQYFTRASIAQLLRRHGFALLEVRTSPKAFTVRYYLERIGGYSEPFASLLVAAAERAGISERLWAPDFRDRMLVLAGSASD